MAEDRKKDAKEPPRKSTPNPSTTEALPPNAEPIVTAGPSLAKLGEILAAYSRITVGTSVPTGIAYPPGDREKVQKLEVTIRGLQDDLNNKSAALETAEKSSADYAQLAADYIKSYKDLAKTTSLAFLLERVTPEASRILIDSETLRTRFLDANAHGDLFVMSVDIRRSTELMLKGKTARAFATFITNLCRDLMDVVRKFNGVVDKFTGDGILCFFPEFFSGQDAGYYALLAAAECHETFDSHYRENRNSFQAVLRDVGLGIGIDYGECHLVQVAGGLTAVGVPVVYACRLAGAPAGTTLLNQAAYQTVSAKYKGDVLLEERSIDVKHEGSLTVYAARLSGAKRQVVEPAWKIEGLALESKSAK